jgi:hypothetical protein
MKPYWNFVLGALVALWAGLGLLVGCETNRPNENPGIVEMNSASYPVTDEGAADGWCVKVCPVHTQADWLRISVGPDEHNISQRLVWHQGDPLEFQVLGGRDYNQIFLAAYSSTDGKPVDFGVCHGTHVCCRHYTVAQTLESGGEGHTIQVSDNDPWNCPE